MKYVICDRCRNNDETCSLCDDCKSGSNFEPKHNCADNCAGCNCAQSKSDEIAEKLAKMTADLKNAATPEPMPMGNGMEVLPGVINDLQDRAEMGRKKYGTTLRADNGRDALMDFLQEQYDGVMYAKQFSMEREIETEVLCQVYVLLADQKHQDKVIIAQSADLLSQILKKRNVSGVDLNLHQTLG